MIVCENSGGIAQPSTDQKSALNNKDKARSQACPLIRHVRLFRIKVPGNTRKGGVINRVEALGWRKTLHLDPYRRTTSTSRA